MTIKQRLLVVDDTPGICELIRTVAEGLGYEVHVAESYGAFETVFAEVLPTAITLDLQLPGGDGVQILRFLAEQESRVAITLVSGFDT